MKKFIVLILAAAMAIGLVACKKSDAGSTTGNSSANGTETRYSLEHPEPIPEGEEDTQGWLYTRNYRNDVQLSCKLESGYTVTIGMGDKDVGINAIYLNPQCDAPNGAVFYILGERIFIRYDEPQDFVTTTDKDFPTMDAKNIAAYRWGENTFGVDAAYYDEYDYGIAWQNTRLADGKGQYGDELSIEVRDRKDGTLLGMLHASILYDTSINRYYLTEMTEVPSDSTQPQI